MTRVELSTGWHNLFMNSTVEFMFIEHLLYD